MWYFAWILGTLLAAVVAIIAAVASEKGKQATKE